MSKQIHIRLEDNVFDELTSYADESGQSVQNCVSGVLIKMLNQQKPRKKEKASFTFIDLFAGIGGMRIAFDQAGGRCVYSSEWNKYSQQTYLANFGEQPEGDITQVDADSIPDHDILVAGFPCQPFSIAGVSKNRALAEQRALRIRHRERCFLMSAAF